MWERKYLLFARIIRRIGELRLKVNKVFREEFGDIKDKSC